MSTRSGQVAAVDLGATSGRVMLADIGDRRLEMRAVARFANDPVRLWNGTRNALHWDIPGLYANICGGLSSAAAQSDDLVGIGVDSWAVDYGLLRNGALLSTPHHYRDDRSTRGVELVHAEVGPAELYRRNGLQFLPFNTVYQLAAERADGLLGLADTVLLVPDLINYWLTGRLAAERTNASTTGLLGLDGTWDGSLMDRLRLPRNLFPDVVEAGSTLGPVLPSVGEQLRLGEQTQVVSVASHDTASAVAAIPMRPDSAAYISCGTWALVGVELSSPVVTDAGRKAGFTNEIGADGRVRFLHNVMGTWLLSETVREYERAGRNVGLTALLEQAESAPAPSTVFDTNDPRFLPPGDIPGRIEAWYAERGLPAPTSPAQMVRTIVESLAAAFADGVAAAAELSGIDVACVHIVGGGSQNRLLCQLTADRLGLAVLAGPVEATALGNILLTARARGLIEGDLEAMRAMVARHVAPTRYLPTTRQAAQPVAVR